jgi:hypothetical protein
MEEIGRTEPDCTKRNFEAHIFAREREEPETLAERIAAVLHERRRIGEERRRREHEHRLHNAERPVALYRRLRGEAKPAGCRINELDALYEAVISSNAADEAIKAHRMEAS